MARRSTACQSLLLLPLALAAGPSLAGVGHGDSAPDTLDAVLPVVAVEFPGEEEQLRGLTTVGLRWSAFDTRPGQRRVLVWIDGAAADSLLDGWTSGAYTWEWQVPDVLGRSCQLEVAVRDRFGNAGSAVSPDFTIVPATSGAPAADIAVTTRLEMPQPNPFNPVTTIRCHLREAGSLRLDVFDLRGRLVRRVTAGHREGGVHEFTWRGDDESGRRVGAGAYLVRLEHVGRAGRTVQVRKVVMLP
jgi:hypothetical protein